MVGAIRLISQWWIWLALFFVAMAVVFWRQSSLAKRDARFSIFGLEKEQAQRRKVTSRGKALLMVLLAVCVYGLSQYAVPLLPATGVESEPTSVGSPQPTATATMTPSVYIEFLRGTEEAEALLAASTPRTTPSVTATAAEATVEPTSEPTSTPAPAMVSGCSNPGVQITSPGSGSTVSGVVSVSGVASIASFQFYKLEIAVGAEPSGWSVIGELHNDPVQGGVLGTWDTSGLATGTYWLRLVVVDQTGNYPSPCAISVNVTN